MNGARTVRMTIGIHERRRINPSVGHWMWPLVKEFCLYWNHTKVLLSVVFNWKVCAICGKGTGSNAAEQELSSESKQRTPVLNSFQSLLIYTVGWFITEPRGPNRVYLKFTHCFAEIEFEDVRGWYEKQDNVWGRHQKQDLLRVQWRRGSHRSARHFMLNNLRTEQ